MGVLQCFDLRTVLLFECLYLLYMLPSEFLALSLVVLFQVPVTITELLFPSRGRLFEVLDLGLVALI